MVKKCSYSDLKWRDIARVIIKITFIYSPSMFACAIGQFVLDDSDDIGALSIPNIAPTVLSDKEPQNTETNLFLNVSVNRYPSTDLIQVKKDNKNQFSISAFNLRALRLKIDPNIQDGAWVNLQDLPWLNVEYDTVNQNLQLKAPVEYLKNYELSLQAPLAVDDIKSFQPINTAIINYSFYQVSNNNKSNVTGNADLMFNRSWGGLNTGLLYNSDKMATDGVRRVIRLGSNWRYIDPIAVRSYTIGDFVTNTTDWNSSTRLAGVQWSSAYDQRSDMVTIALPEFSGSAALPSTLDLYINQQRIYSGLIPSGPFDLKSLPFVSGNKVTLVTTDETGQQVVSTKSYYSSPKILSKNITQFSLDMGIPRYFYGKQSNNYDSSVFFTSLSARKGLTSSLSLSSGLEASTDGLLNIGAGLAKNILEKGVLSVDLSGSSYQGKQGLFFSTSIETNITEKMGFNAGFQNSLDHYYNLARVANLRFEKKSGLISNDGISESSSARQSLRLGLNYSLPKSSNLYFGYNSVTTPMNSYKQASLSLSSSISSRWGMFFSAYKDLLVKNSYGAYLTLSYTPKKPSLSISHSASVSNGVTSQKLELRSASTSRLGSIGWGASANYVEPNNYAASAYVNYLHRYAYLSAKYGQMGHETQSSLSANGALVWAGGRLFATNQVSDGYALVKNAGPKSQIVNGGVTLGETDRAGRFFIANLTPYKTSHIYVNPENLPLDWRIDTTDKTVMTGYKQGVEIDFGARKVISAIIHLVDSANKDLEPGYTVMLNESNRAIIGYGGEVFVDGLLPKNTLVVDLLERGQCTVHFDYKGTASGIEKIGPFICQ